MAVDAPNNTLRSNRGHSSDSPPAKETGRVQAPDHEVAPGRTPLTPSVVGWHGGAIPIRPNCHDQSPMRKAR